MATIYLWGKFDLTGHVSIAFANGRYSSWHPAFSNSKIDDFAPVAGTFVNGSVDQNNHPRGASHQLTVSRLDEAAMLRRHEKLKSDAENGRLKYSLGHNNCSRIAADILSHGHGDGLHFFTHVDVVLHRILDHNSKSLPYNLPDLAQDAAKSYNIATAASRATRAAARVNPFARAALGLAVLTETLIWTPRDVVELARIYDEGHL
jgi:hypothetical protein